MLRTARLFGSILPIGVGVALAWTGCAQVFDIDDWQEGGAGGRGGDGSQQSTAGSSVTTLSNGSGAQVTAASASASASASSGGQGGGDTCDGMCLPPVPPDWQGYVAAIMTDKANPLPPCGPLWPSQQDYKTELYAPPATCGACNCSNPSGSHCNLTAVSLGAFGDAQCANGAGTSVQVASPGCAQLPSGGLNTLHVRLTGQSLPSGGACMPNGSPAGIEPAYFKKHARLCAGPVASNACSVGEQCVPKPPDDFPFVCIYRTTSDNASIDCPDGYNPAPDFFTDFTDNRGCSACTCGPPFAQTCEMSAQVFSNGSCVASGSPIYVYPGGCSAAVTAANGVVSALVVPGSPQGGSCNPSTPNPTGNAYGTGRTLVCCLP